MLTNGVLVLLNFDFKKLKIITHLKIEYETYCLLLQHFLLE